MILDYYRNIRGATILYEKGSVEIQKGRKPLLKLFTLIKGDKDLFFKNRSRRLAFDSTTKKYKFILRLMKKENLSALFPLIVSIYSSLSE